MGLGRCRGQVKCETLAEHPVELSVDYWGKNPS